MSKTKIAGIFNSVITQIQTPIIKIMDNAVEELHLLKKLDQLQNTTSETFEEKWSNNTLKDNCQYENLIEKKISNKWNKLFRKINNLVEINHDSCVGILKTHIISTEHEFLRLSTHNHRQTWANNLAIVKKLHHEIDCIPPRLTAKAVIHLLGGTNRKAR